MLRRELPLGETRGRIIRFSQGRIAPGVNRTPLMEESFWGTEIQPLCWWHDEPVGLLIENQPDDDWPDGRAWLAELPESWFPLISTVLQVAEWSRNHRFCGRCGASTRRVDSEFAMHCDSCGHRNYPRISPCIITLVTHGEDLLLARSPRFPPGRYSTLAGFIEPGESAEQALHREVYEEVGLTIGRMRYVRSQAWPFPHSLMLGYLVEAASRRICIDGHEIEDAAWFSPRRLPQLPPPYSISRELIELHLAEVRDGR
ncbi:NAD(+) diphosphatase [Halomonas binhaiensis]|uniref:NAD(+) diphosphatase n=1 Tax=Halomonas binhaiensis TaxID=2562282 RepID=A0A5C1NEI3_9GAMM|nr:NAD(+) diphosphatase [Halomonas binhaiensis]QEM81664.1 NAD(+) diphosphatase [Halomonas binhaiensis]